jgi:hypothetical protein
MQLKNLSLGLLELETSLELKSKDCVLCTTQ